MENGSPHGRMPRWTKNEILVLIQAKRHVETSGGGYVTRGRPIVCSGGSLAPPKWVAIASTCEEHGVHRGPTQCRKRWGNLSAAFRKIKEYERKRKEGEEAEKPVDGEHTYWAMDFEERKGKGLPGRFERAVYDRMEGKEVDDVVDRVYVDEDDVAMDSEEEEGKLTPEIVGNGNGTNGGTGGTGPALSPIPISMRRFQPFQEGSSDPEMENGTQPEDLSDKASPQKEGQKRKRSQSFNEEENEMNFTEKLMETIERGSRLIAAQLDAHNIQAQLDRDLRREEIDKLLKVFNRIADSIEKIAQK